MTSSAPTILAVETGAAWVVVLAVSLVTLPAALLLRRLIGRPGGLASGLLLALPLLVPPLAAFAFQGALLPELAVLRPARSVFEHGTRELLHLLYFHEGGDLIPYVAWGTARNWALVAGLAVTSFMLVRRAVGTAVVRTVVARCRPAEGAAASVLADGARRLARAAGLARPPEVLLLPPGIGGAFAVGALRPRILLSEDLIGRLDADELEAVLAHEVAHVSARDVHVVFWAGLLRDMVAWNPVAHFAYRRLVDDREREADRRAAAMTGNPLAVASSLVKMCDGAAGSPPGLVRAALAFLRPGGRVARRVDHLLDVADGRAALAPTRRLPYVVAAVVVAALGLHAGARLAAESEAIAIVIGVPQRDAAAAPGRPERAVEPAGQQAAPERAQKAAKRRGGARRAEIESPQRDLASLYSFRAEDLHLWLSQMSARAAEGVSPATLTWETRRDWEAVPIRCTMRNLCIYRVDGI